MPQVRLGLRFLQVSHEKRSELIVQVGRNAGFEASGFPLMTFNDLADLEGEARRTLEFLELPWDPQVLQYRERMRNKAVSSPTYEAVSKPLYTSAIGRWRNYRRYLEPCLETLQPCVEAFGYQDQS